MPNSGDTPEVVNEDPYDRGWMIVIRPQDPSHLESLLSAADYEAFIREDGGGHGLYQLAIARGELGSEAARFWE